MKTPAALLALSVLWLSVPPPATAAQLCGCKKVTTGRVAKITAGAFPTCNLLSQVLVCWEDTASTVTSITAGNGLQATPANPITNTGTVSVDAPMCSAPTDKLLWDGSAFQCGVDQGGASGASAKVYLSANVLIPDSTDTVLSWDSEYFDTAGIHDSVHPSRLTAPTTGTYLIMATAPIANLAGTQPNSNWAMKLILNGGDPSGPGIATLKNFPISGYFDKELSTVLSLQQGDYVELDIYQSGTGVGWRAAGGLLGSEFEMAKLP